MAPTKRERNLLIFTITVVVVGVNYFLLSWLVGPWRETQRSLTAQRKELAAYKMNIAQAPKWQANLEELGHDLKASARFETVSDVLKKVDDLTASSGISMQSKRSLKMEERDVSREWPISCAFEANIDSLVKFLHGLQTSSGFMNVEQLNITAKPDSSGILRCDIQIRALAAKGGGPS